MFSSQLLRILQAIPADVNYESSAFDTCESKLTMKQNQIGIVCHSNSYQREAEPVSFSSSDSYHTNGHGRNMDPLAFGILDGHDFWNNSETKGSEVLDNYSNSGGSPMVGDQDGIFCNLNGCEKGTESLASDRKDKDEIKVTPEPVHSMMDVEVMNSKEKESGDSEMSCTSAQSNMPSYTDKNVVECELPELVVCYRESNFHAVKDICVDEGMPVHKKVLIESDKDDDASFVSKSSAKDAHGQATNGEHATELQIPDQSKASSVEDIMDNSAAECGVEEVDIVSSVMNGSKSSEDIACKNIADKTEDDVSVTETAISCSYVLQKMNGSKSSEDISCKNIADKTEDDISATEPAISCSYVLQELIVQDSLKGPSNFDGNKAAQQPDEIPPIEAILESAFTSEESKKYGPVSNSCYNSKLDGGTITFDFNSLKPAVECSMGGSAEIIHEKALKSEDDQLDDNLPATADQSADTVLKSNENIHDQNLLRQDGPIHDNWNSGNLLVSSQVQRGEGETSFSASGPVSGLITHSGPIAYSGSISLRSDSSTTSARSFAFPVLQSEWNSSPVRMKKAERRRLRKHRRWMHGLFCCRF